MSNNEGNGRDCGETKDARGSEVVNHTVLTKDGGARWRSGVPSLEVMRNKEEDSVLGGCLVSEKWRAELMTGFIEREKDDGDALDKRLNGSKGGGGRFTIFQS